MTKIFGPFVAIVTPFDANEAIDEAALRRQVDRQAKAGNGVFCAGTNGEFYALSFQEKLRVAEICAEAAAGRVPVLAHIGEISTHETIALGKLIEKLDIKAMSAITPSFIACSQAELVNHYRRVADAMSKPVYLYNIPARTGNTIQPETARILADHPNIIGIKDSAGSQESLDAFLAIAKERQDFDVLVGADSLVLHGLQNGAAGCISGLGNISPVTLNAIHASFVAGDAAAATKHQDHYSALRKELYAHGFPPAMVKRALRVAMPEVGASRAPVLISDEVNAKVSEISKRFAEAIN
ncbi:MULTISPECIES: dihydrodipicolinate synthase family protein [Rhodopseudomonas]|uniref:Dihydrodipicolinate synthetase n=1 Tax=Rhodopseudomonas palustris TaxID=1076 RepID=A0A0D7F8A9_RHOPL|nr:MULTISPECIES: dihydrodipicolinate synthase family protein [Rhodopseudomonas]KIZ47957.1 dihydrodipicolinate synthetase [Rhodopseudomonas palustris]MDF3811145.1 dihydrodipicolinate synthase family protein [Rhodopseudomonas sp. BAL398]WOK16784.1 dihydrodipicolinate synthase family protein [Rhodopseudomonas sp. BAL398]